MGEVVDGEVFVKSTEKTFSLDFFRFIQIVSKVSNVDIMSREVVKSLFYENLNDFITNNLKEYNILEKATPTKDKTLIVDYEIKLDKPIYIFGVNSEQKASKVIINCLNFINQKITFKSLIVHENFDDLSNYNRNQLTNVSGKQFTTLPDFINKGPEYIQREVA